MTSTSTDIREGVNTSVAIKAPVRSVCTSNISASGLSAISTIDGSLTPADGDRFLLTAQTSNVNNGIYVAASGTWARAKDFDSNREIRKGTLITTQGGIQYRLTSSDPITIGTSGLTFASNDNTALATSLASTGVGAGASLVGINDAGSLITATTVEAALQEIAAASWVTSGRIASNAVTPVKLATASLYNGPLVNGYLDASVAANAITVAVKTFAGTDPSATDPVYVVFRNVTAGTGSPTVITLTAALSLVVSSGSTLGTVSGTAHRVYVGIANDGGTARLFVYNPYNATDVIARALYDGQINSSTTEGGAGGADSALTLYSGTAFTSKAVAVVGYFESTQATAGTWATAPSKIHTLRPGDKRTGDIVQIRSNIALGSAVTGTATIPFDNTIPQNNEGDQYMADTIAVTSTINLLEIDVLAWLTNSAASGSAMILALFRDSVAGALAAVGDTHTAAKPLQLFLSHRMLPPAASVEFKVRAGLEAAGTTTFNGSAGAGIMGGVIKSYLRTTEVFV